MRGILGNQLYGTATNSTPIHLDEVLCSGNEISLLNCNSSLIGQGVSGCDHSDDAGVKCGGT